MKRRQFLGTAGAAAAGVVAAGAVSPVAAAGGARKSLKDFGAVGNGADDTAAVQAAIDSFDAPFGVPGGELLVTPGTYRLTDTIRIDRKALALWGTGSEGSTSNLSPASQTATFAWDGPGGVAMFEVTDSKGLQFFDINFQGNQTRPPSALFFFNSAGGSIGTNEQLRFERCRFGGGSWTNPPTLPGPAADRGVWFDGQNANNDQFHFTDCAFQACGVGLALSNTQSVWGELSNCVIGDCGVGLQTASSVTLENLTCNDNDLDVELNSSARMVIHGFWTENATQVALITNQGHLSIFGGMITALRGTHAIDHRSCGDAGGLILMGLRMNTGGGAHHKLKVRGLASGTGWNGSVTMLDCPGWDFADLDIANVVSGDLIYVFIASGGMFIERQLMSGQTLEQSVEFPKGSVVVGGGSALATDATDGFLYIPTVAGIPNGVPAPKPGSVPLVYNVNDNRLYIYNGDTWRAFG